MADPRKLTFGGVINRKVPIWLDEALSGINGTDLIRALELWHESGRPQGLRKAKKCSWCQAENHGTMCLACRKMKQAGWTAKLVANGRIPVPPVEELAKRVERIEAALFIDPVGRVETGPFAPPAIIEMLEAGIRDEINNGVIDPPVEPDV